MDMRSPGNKMNPKAKKAWILGGVIDFAIGLTIAIVFYIVNNLFFGFTNAITIVLVTLSSIVGIIEIFIIPRIRMYQWCYEINEDEIDIQNGIIVINRTLIPIVRIQHVDTEKGPILRYFNLATVSISTAGSTHKIPALYHDEALKLRNRISKLARVSEEDV